MANFDFESFKDGVVGGGGGGGGGLNNNDDDEDDDGGVDGEKTNFSVKPEKQRTKSRLLFGYYD